MKIRQLGKRMAKEGIPEDYAINLIQQSNGNINLLKELIRVHLEEINADNINNKIRRICKSTK